MSPADAMFRVVRGCVCSQARGARVSKESWESYVKACRSCLYCAPKSLSPALVGFFWTDVVISDEPGDEDESVD